MIDKLILKTLIDKRAELEKREIELKEKLFSNPLSEVCRLRIQLGEKIKNKELETPEGMKWLNESAKKEKELMALAKWQHDNLLSGSDNLSRIAIDISNLNWEISRREYQDKDDN